MLKGEKTELAVAVKMIIITKRLKLVESRAGGRGGTFFEAGQSVFGDVFVAQKNQLLLDFIFCEIQVFHNSSCKTEEAEIRNKNPNKSH